MELVSSKGLYRLLKSPTGMWQVEKRQGPYSVCQERFHGPDAEKKAKKFFKKK